MRWPATRTRARRRSATGHRCVEWRARDRATLAQLRWHRRRGLRTSAWCAPEVSGMVTNEVCTAAQSDAAAQRQRSRTERLCLLAPEPSGLTGCLDGCLLDVGDGSFEFVRVACADGDQPGDPEDPVPRGEVGLLRSEEHTSELQSLMRISYAGFCLK